VKFYSILPQSEGHSLEEYCTLHKIPRDDNSIVWRYMRTKYFVSMTLTSMAYFRRLDRLEDQFEAAYSPHGYEATADELTRMAAERNIELPEGVDPTDTSLLTMGSIEAIERASVFVNCWHRNDHESWAMWKLFARDADTNDRGVAIRSTIGRLKDSFNAGLELARVLIGDVEYIDHETDPMPCPLQWLYKNHMFSWEREVRLWKPFGPRETSIVGFNEDHPEGFGMRVDLATLIGSVVVSPGSGEETRASVQHLLEQNGLAGIPVLASAADTEPYYRKYYDLNRQTILDGGIAIEIHRRDGDLV
jgi:hypothetical protein